MIGNGRLAVDGWAAVTFGTARRSRSPPRLLLAVSNVTAHPPTASVPRGTIIAFGVYISPVHTGD